MSDPANAATDYEAIVPVQPKPWCIVNGVPYFECMPGMSHSLAFAFIHDNIVPTSFNKPADDNEAFSDEYRKAFDVVVQKFDRYKRWFLILISSQQIRILEGDDLKSFLRMNGNREHGVKEFLEVIRYCANEQHLFSGNENLEIAFPEYSFSEYNTSASTTPALIARAMNSCPIPGVFTEHEIAKVTAALGSPHDITCSRAIPKIAIFKSRAILEALDVCPVNWYMGQKGWEKGDPDMYRALVSIVEKAAAVTAGIVTDETLTIKRCVAMYEELDLK